MPKKLTQRERRAARELGLGVDATGVELAMAARRKGVRLLFEGAMIQAQAAAMAEFCDEVCREGERQGLSEAELATLNAGELAARLGCTPLEERIAARQAAVRAGHIALTALGVPPLDPLPLTTPAK